MSERADTLGVTEPALSVILCTLNGEQTIAAQLQALASQETSVQFETIVVDNGSTDRTVEIVQHFAEGSRSVRVVAAPEQQNLSYARNVGVDAAAAEWLAFCDDDDLVGERWVEALAAALPNAQFVASSMDYRRLGDVHADSRGFQSTQIEEMFGRPIANGAIAISRSIWTEVGGNDEHFGGTGEDFDFALRVTEATGVRPVLARDAVYHYRSRSGGRAVFHQMRRYGTSHVQLYRRHGVGQVDRRRHTIEALRNWWWVVTRAPLAVQPSRRENWMRQAGRRVGRLIGSFRYRVCYL